MFYIYLWIAAQIIIEMLPISSSGHLILLELLLKKYTTFNSKKYFTQDIYYFLHGPTLLVVCGYFFSHWWRLIFSSKGIAWNLIICLLIADFITYFFYRIFQKVTIHFPLVLGFLITSVALFSTMWCAGNKPIELASFTDAALLGLAQGLALLPGISRLAFTCSIGCWLGFSLQDAFFLSWTIQVPLMAAAFAKSLKNLYELGALKQVLNPAIGLVMLSSSGLSFLILNVVGQMAQHESWYWFGFYMIVPLSIWVLQCSYPSTRPNGLHRDER